MTIFREIRFNTEELEKLKEKTTRITEELAGFQKNRRSLRNSWNPIQ